MRCVQKIARAAAFLLSLACLTASAETCTPQAEMDAATRSSLQQAGQLYAADGIRGDAGALRLAAIPSLASNFSGLEAVVRDQAAKLAGAQPSLRAAYLLEAPGSGTLERASFACGAFGTPLYVAMSLPSLPAGRYALVIEDLKTRADAWRISMVLKQEGDWKLAGYFSKPLAYGGKDGLWYWRKARDYKALGQTRNAWLYYRVARELLLPVEFISTPQLEKLETEAQGVAPQDLPTENPVDLAGGGKIYKLTAIFPVGMDTGLDLVVRYAVPDVSNSQLIAGENAEVIQALLAKFPELREAFTGVVARATDPAGRDFGTLLPTKDVK